MIRLSLFLTLSTLSLTLLNPSASYGASDNLPDGRSGDTAKHSFHLPHPHFPHVFHHNEEKKENSTVSIPQSSDNSLINSPNVTLKEKASDVLETAEDIGIAIIGNIGHGVISGAAKVEDILKDGVHAVEDVIHKIGGQVVDNIQSGKTEERIDGVIHAEQRIIDALTKVSPVLSGILIVNPAAQVAFNTLMSVMGAYATTLDNQEEVFDKLIESVQKKINKNQQAAAVLSTSVVTDGAAI